MEFSHCQFFILCIKIVLNLALIVLFKFYLIKSGSPTLTHRTTGGLSTTANSTGASSTRLDPKYFQSHASHQLSSLEVVPLKQQLNKQTSSSNTCANNGLSSSNSVRINKQVIPSANGNQNSLNNQQSNVGLTQNGNLSNGQYSNGTNGLISNKSTPSLASAYFPSN